jgi:hypothetical protein
LLQCEFGRFTKTGVRKAHHKNGKKKTPKGLLLKTFSKKLSKKTNAICFLVFFGLIACLGVSQRGRSAMPYELK